MQSGFYLHVHHDRLMEWCYDYEGRRRFILDNKPTEEQELRLRLFQPVKGQLPADLLQAGAAYDQAEATNDQAEATCDQAWAACDTLLEARAVCDQAWVAWDQAEATLLQAKAARAQAWAAYDQAEATLSQAKAAHVQTKAAVYLVIEAHKTEIETLHAQECPNCPWDGKSIFPDD